MKLTLVLDFLSGSSHDIGLRLAGLVKTKYGSNYIDSQLGRMKNSFLYSALGMKYQLDKGFIIESANFVIDKLSTYDPELLKEIDGLAQGLNEDSQKVKAFILNFGNGHGCTHLFFNGVHAHNYDDHPENSDMQFLIVKNDTNYLSIGESLAQVNRVDGMNEKGLSVSLSWGAGELPTKLGLSAEMFIRIILDKAANVDEALDLFHKVGYGSPNNLLIADRENHAVVIEKGGDTFNVRKAKDEIIFCANSYLSNEMQSMQQYKNPTTKWRESLLSELSTNLSTKDIQDLFTLDYPNGLFEPYFGEELGTLWTVLFKHKDLSTQIILGEKESTNSIEINFNNLQHYAFPLVIENEVKNIPLAMRVYPKD